jgi:hypothetical protein
VPAFEIDFMKKVPTTWDETLYIDGYPGKYTVIARRHGATWYVAGANAEKEALKLKLNLPMLAGKKISLINDDAAKAPYQKAVTVNQSGEFEVEMQPSGGFVLHQ